MTGFGELALALLLFLASHSLPALPAVRGRLVGLLGERAYLALYSLLSAAMLAWLIAAALRAPYRPLWPPAAWATWVPALVMPFAAILLVAGLTTPNPLSVGFRAAGFDPDRPGIVAVTRHPVLWAFTLWAAAHLAANGDVAAVLLFGLFAAFGLAGMRLVDARRRRRLGAAAWRRLSAGTSVVPFAAVLAGRARLDWRGLGPWRVAGGLLLYAGLFPAHERVIGVSPLPPL